MKCTTFAIEMDFRPTCRNGEELASLRSHAAEEKNLHHAEKKTLAIWISKKLIEEHESTISTDSLSFIIF